MPSRQLLSQYRPGASLFLARAPIDSSQVVGHTGWYAIEVNSDSLVVGSDMSRLNTATITLNTIGTYYVQARGGFVGNASAARRIIAIEVINDFVTPGGDGLIFGRTEAGPSNNQWVAECSGIVRKPDTAYYGVRMLLWQETGANLNTNNANQAVQSELNIRRLA